MKPSSRIVAFVVGLGVALAGCTNVDSFGDQSTQESIAAVTGCAEQLLAGNGAVASSVRSGTQNTAAKAIDANTGTRWESAFTDAEWIYVDLGANRFVSRVRINWEGAYGKNYDVQIGNSTTGPWTTLKAVRNNTTSGIKDYTGLAGAGRYVRVNGINRGTGYGYSIWELEVYGDNSPTCGDAGAGGSNGAGGSTGTGGAGGSGGAGGAGDGGLACKSDVLARNTATSSPGPIQPAANAVDGKTTTRWESAYTNAEWISVDLGASALVNRVRLNWEGAYGKDYDLQIAADPAGPWALLTSVRGNTSAGVKDYTGLSGTGRYVRMNGIARGTGYGYSIWELEVFGDTNPSCGSAPVACTETSLTTAPGLAASASSQLRPASAAFDNDATTRWESAQGVDPSYLYVDLGARKHISRVDINWEAACAKDYQIRVSDDGAVWTPIKSVVGNTLSGVVSLTGLSAAGRFVEMYGTARCLPYGYSIFEMDVFGDANADCAGATVRTITSPANGAVLKARSQAFNWQAGADEYWLRIGTSAGGADLYDSPSLGTQTSTTVTGLPLSGAPLYAELRSRKGTVTSSSAITLTAPFRKGICIIADFADKTLESWTGDGMKSVADVSAQLRQMEAHWNWLSRGLEKAQWDIVRVKLSQNLAPNLFANLWAYREEVARLAAPLVNVADYDTDRDGVVDMSWVIAATNGVSTDAGSPYQYMEGGTGLSLGFAMFVDSQSSQSVREGRTGNFNHEVGHCLGVPDLYGDYSSTLDLTLMHDSWLLPAIDFAAYERVKLGWVVPTVVSQTTRGVVLASANDKLAAVKVTTPRAGEYYLLEYRKRPASGFGSSTADYNGLAVYHVLEGANQNQNPPLFKLESATGYIAPAGVPGPSDLLYPGNPQMSLPFKVGTYFAAGTELQIENVQWASGGIQFDVVVFGDGGAANLVTNPTFESGTTPWTTSEWGQSGPAVFSWANIGHGDSAHSIAVSSSAPNDAQWIQNVAGLTAGQSYQVCAWVKSDSVVGYEYKNIGANLSVVNGADTISVAPGVQRGFGSLNFTQACIAFPAAAIAVTVGCRLGNTANTSTGTVWCDDVTLSAVHPAF